MSMSDKINIDELKEIVQICKNEGYDFLLDYGGRGMRNFATGKHDHCFAITGDMGTLWAFCALVASQCDEGPEITYKMGPPTSDAFGQHTIFYWPKILIDDETEKLLTEEFDL